MVDASLAIGVSHLRNIRDSLDRSTTESVLARQDSTGNFKHWWSCPIWLTGRDLSWDYLCWSFHVHDIVKDIFSHCISQRRDAQQGLEARMPVQVYWGKLCYWLFCITTGCLLGTVELKIQTKIHADIHALIETELTGVRKWEYGRKHCVKMYRPHNSVVDLW